MSQTGEEMGYQDAMRQVLRSLQRRLKVLQEDCKSGDEAKLRELRIRIAEVHHIIQVVESLHR